MRFSQLIYFGVFLVGLSLAPACRAQQFQISPNPARIDEKITITGAGFIPNSPIGIVWDNPSPTTPAANFYLPNPPTANANGAFSLTLDVLPLNLYPATVGQHTFTFVWVGNTGEYEAKTVPFALTARQGWAAPIPLPSQASPQFTGGVLAFLRYTADLNSTSLVVSNGQQERVLGTAAAGALLFNQPDWSPDGNRIAFSVQLDTAPDQNLYTLDVTNGALNQVTAEGGAPPVLTGGRVGSLTGSVLPYLGEAGQGLVVTPPEDAGCLDMFRFVKDPDSDKVFKILNDEFFPKGVTVSLVGTGLSVAVPLPPGSQNGDPFPFVFTNLPEGDYSLHIYHNAIVCQDDTVPVAGGGTKQVQRKAAGVPSLTIPVHISAGQNTALEPQRVVDGYTLIQNSSWLNNTTLLFNKVSGVYSVAKGPAVSDVWSTTAGQAPVQITDTLKNGKITDLNASVADGLFMGSVDPSVGLFFAEPNPATVLSSFRLVTSWYPIFYYISATTTDYAATTDHTPAWDPSGGYIAFIRLFPQANQTVGIVALKEIATGQEKALTEFNVNKLASGEGYAGRPAWSPDRKQIAVTFTTDNLKTANIRIINVADGSFFDLTNDGRSALPTWTAARPLTGMPENLDFQPTIPVPDFKAGDLNEDSQVTVSDGVLALRISVGLETATARHLQIGDLNKDGQINVVDAIGILRIVVGLPG